MVQSVFHPTRHVAGDAPLLSDVFWATGGNAEPIAFMRRRRGGDAVCCTWVSGGHSALRTPLDGLLFGACREEPSRNDRIWAALVA